MKKYLGAFVPHLICMLLFVIVSLAYFSPVLSGKTIFQSDIAQHNGMAKELRDFRAATGEETYWTDSAFGGMPTYQLGAQYPHNYIKKLDATLRFLPRPADYLFLYFIGMYILFLVLKLDYKLAFLGALAFGFSTYLIIILGVGHNAKAHAIAYMPLVLSGIILTFRGKFLWGMVLTAIAMGLELSANHFQMTYYLLLLVVCVGIAYLVDAFKKNLLPHYFKAIGVMVIAVLIALGLNATNLMATKEYADTSTRGESELTINPDGTPKVKTEGLDYDYITTYSYGQLETLNLFIPRFLGGGSSEEFPEDSATENVLLQMGATPQQAVETLGQIPLYWGDQPIVAAPAYIGAVIIFLAVLALFLVRGRLKWWGLSAFLLSLFLSWGRNLEFLTEIFIDYVPLYNKFRAVSSIQVIIELVLPILAIVGLQQFFNEFVSEEKRKKALMYATGIVGGFCVLVILFKSTLFDFVSPYDGDIIEAMGAPFIDAVREDRMAVMQSDSIRSLILVLLTAGALWVYSIKKIKMLPAVGVLIVIILFDLVGVDKRYVTNDDFVNKRVMEQPFPRNPSDDQILKDKGRYRVYDAANNAFNSAQTSYYHSSLGGYHAAKPGRMQDLADFYINQGDIGVLNMMNVRYITLRGKNGGIVAQRNPYANGNAWFVENVIIAQDANQEILQLDSLDTKKTVVINASFTDELPLDNIQRDSTATIELVKNTPNHLVYEAATKSPQLAVFSEVYYPKGWNAYIDGEKATYIRADYLLRAMTVPEGFSKIEFKFEPLVIKTGSAIALGSSIVLLLLVLGVIGFRMKKKGEA
ncbi:hypothetical protein [Patiriisocius marinus]|uniref:hypothetical protein n=1 Tax=Patiriisocius marinus TaxID=1397112 RepID=UPI00232F9D6F|nr:hypothetical protein [Patiriisocius marinus]